MRTAIVLLLLATSAHAADLPKYWTVHVDVPADRAAFERADREDAATRAAFYAAHELPPPATWRISGGGSYFSLRPRGATLSDLERPASLTTEQSRELAAKTRPLSEAAHQTLRDHHNEIWQLDTDFTTATSFRNRRHVLLRTDTISPPKIAAYNEAMSKIVRELAAHGVETVAFFSAYGDGTARYVFLSDVPIRVARVGKLARSKDVKVTSALWNGADIVQPAAR